MIYKKTCKHCDNEFKKRPRDSYKQWESKKYCSKECSNTANGLKRHIPIDKRFFSKIDKKDCWIWLGVKDNNGYGKIHLDQQKGKCIGAHRYSYKYHYGDFDKELNICHKCDNPSCVNPEHLFLGTQKDNMTDAYMKGRINNYIQGAGEKNNAAKLSNKDVGKMRDEYKKGATIDYLKEKYENTNVVRILRNKAYHDSKYQPINANARKRPSRLLLNPNDVEYIISSNLSSRKLASKFNVTKTTILNIKKRGY